LALVSAGGGLVRAGPAKENRLIISFEVRFR